MTIFNPAPAEAAILDSVAGYTQLGFRVAPSSDFDYAGVVIGVFSVSGALISWKKVSSAFANNNYILIDQLTSSTEYLVKVSSIDDFIYNDDELIEASLNEENELLNLESVTVNTLEVPALISLSNTLYNDAFTGTNVEARLSNSNFNYATISSNIDGVLENELSASTSLKFSASINTHSITLQLFRPLVEGTVETVTLSGSVNVTEIADGYLDDLEDRINNNIDEIGSRTSTLETESRISRRNLQEANIAVLDSVAEAALKRDALNRVIRENGRLVNAVVEVDPETGTITNKAYSYTDERFAEASLVIDGVKGSITSITEELTVTNDTLSDLSTTVTQLPGEFEVIANQVVANEIATITPAHVFNFYDSAQGWVAVNGTLSATTPKQIDVTWGDVERSWVNPEDQYVAEENPRIIIELERILPAGYPDTHTEVLDWTGDIYVDLYDPDTQTSTTEHFVGKITAPGLEGVQIISADFAGEDRYVGNVTRLRLVLGASTDDEFSIRNITIGKADAQTQLLDSIGERVSTAEVKISALESEIEFTTTLDEVKNNINTSEAGDSIIESSTMGLLLDANEKFSQMFGQYQTINDNNVIENAGRAGLFIDVDPESPDFVSFSTYAQNIQEQFDGYYTTTQVDTQIDGVKGTITDQSLQILTQKREGQDALQAQTDALVEYALFKAKVTDQNITFARAISQLNTDVGPDGALAEQITELEAVFTQEQSIRQAQVNSLSESIADVDGARARDRTELEAEVGGARTFAIDQISGQVGYCSIDGEPTGYGSASECAEAGGTWVEESLFANSVRSIGFTTGNDETVTVSDIADAFQSVNGALIARRSFVLDNNGNISGLFLDNNGSTTNTNFITDTFTVGRLVNDVYTPDLSLENGVLTLRGRLVVGTGEDEYVLDSEDSIRALDGQDGAGFYKVQSSTDPSNLSNSQITSLFTSFMGRSPIDRDTILIQGPSELEGYIHSGAVWNPVGVLVNGDMIVSGSVSADRLAIRGGGSSLIPNTSFRNGSLEGWFNSQGSVVQRDPNNGSTAISTCPAGYMYSMPAGSSDISVSCLNWGEPVKHGDRYMITFDAATSGTSPRRSDIEVYLKFSDGSGQSLGPIQEFEKVVFQGIDSTTWDTYIAGPFSVPEGGATIRYAQVNRLGSNSGGGFYFTNFRVYKQSGSVEIADGAIRANKLNLRNVRNDTNTIEMTLDPGSDSPIEIKDITNNRALFSIGYDGTTPKALVNGTAGTGFISNSQSITAEVKRSINPYYLSTGDSAQGSGTILTSGDTDQFSINTGESGLVNINIDLSAYDRYEDSSESLNWEAPKWRVLVRRGNTTIFDRTYTGVAGNTQSDYPPTSDPKKSWYGQDFWAGYYSIRIEEGISDEAPTNQSVIYTLEVIKVSGTADSLNCNDYSAKVAAFLRNSLDIQQDPTGLGIGSWTDKETGFTYQWGYTTISAYNVNTVTFPENFTTCFQVLAAMDMYSSSGPYANAGVVNGSITNTSFKIENETDYRRTVRWVAVGII